MIYLDYNATTPIDKSVADEMLPFLTTHYGNPSSSHNEGVFCRNAVQLARERVAKLLSCHSNEVVFMSGGTETINFVLKGLAKISKKVNKNHIVTSCIEHVAVLESCKFLESEGVEVTYVGVDEFGLIKVEDVIKSIRPTTFLVTIMHSNNEVGTIQPIKEIVVGLNKIPREDGDKILVHTDASQSIGKIPVSVPDLGVDFLTLAGHKLYGPKGVGALYMKSGVLMPQKLIHGASQERGLRAGTENVLLNVGLGKACEIASDSIVGTPEKMSALRDRLQELIKEKCSISFKVNGHPYLRLPNTLSISFKDLNVGCIMNRIQNQVACSAGSACHSVKEGENTHISYVLTSMNVPSDYIKGTLRLSVGKYTTLEDVDTASSIIADCVNDLGCSKPDSNLDSSTKRKYYDDTYCFNSTAKILSISQGPSVGFDHPTNVSIVVLDQTIFHPQGGGQPSDVGEITNGTAVFRCLHSRVQGKQVHHYGIFLSDLKFCAGDNVTMEIDENKRKLHARLHSAGHLIDKAMSQLGFSLLPLKGNHFEGNAYVEYEGKVEAEIRRTLPKRLTEQCLMLIQQEIPTETKDVSIHKVKEICGSNCDVSHLATDIVRIVTVAGMACPCGGTHIKNTSELGSVVVEKIKAKGNKLKIYYSLD